LGVSPFLLGIKKSPHGEKEVNTVWGKIMGYFSDTSYGADGVWITGSLTASDTAGAVFNWQNDQDVDVIVDLILVDVTTVATAACTLDIGYTATSAATSSDTMIDGVDVNASTGVKNSIKNAGSNGVNAVRVVKAKWITASKKTGATAGLVGKYYIHYRRCRP